jgi:hypothetical protein
MWRRKSVPAWLGEELVPVVSSAPDWSGERPKKAVKSLVARMYPCCVLTVKSRTVMSSVMRRRNGPPAGLMVLSVMGLLRERTRSKRAATAGAESREAEHGFDQTAAIFTA